MKLAGFNFNKISAERLSSKLDKIKINTKIDIEDIQKFELKTFNKDVLKVDFSYSLDYSPDVAKLEFKGSVLFYTETDELKETLDDWKAKKLSESFQTNLFNIILRKTNVKALELEDELNLPFHINMPTLKRKAKEE